MTGSSASELATNHQLPSGKWEGYFKDPRGFDVEKKWPIDVIFSFKANGTTFAAFGVDEIGTFEFKDGKIEGDVMKFQKAYKTHSINYEGTIFNKTVQGNWWFTGSPQEDSGTFSMWPSEQSI